MKPEEAYKMLEAQINIHIGMDERGEETADDMPFSRAAVYALMEGYRAAETALLENLLSKLEKEKIIIAKEIGRDYAHLNFKDGRAHTLMRVEAWATIQMGKVRRGPEPGASETKEESR